MSGTLHEAIREKYGKAALGARTASCCGGNCGDPITSNLYSDSERAAGETVLDLGSGGGIDVLLSARRVGPTGKVYGLDITEACCGPECCGPECCQGA